MSLKSKVYLILRIWKDIDAIRNGRTKQRLGRRVSGKFVGKIIRKKFK